MDSHSPVNRSIDPHSILPVATTKEQKELDVLTTELRSKRRLLVSIEK
jgi:hypothetical protein